MSFNENELKIIKAIDECAEDIIALGKKPINFDFLGIDLTRMVKGNETDLLVWIFPVLAVLATIWSAQISKKQMQTANNGANEQAQSMSNSMMTIMPIMTAFFTYTMPIGMSLYWFVSTVAQIIQQAVITKVVNKELENKSSERKDKR